jgi:hypothetical protein
MNYDRLVNAEYMYDPTNLMRLNVTNRPTV